ncbi:MAG: antirestriction protein ArdA [Defluviitaleaceae bacterium]|nr:antirestriction protein ArdA [Defluviitaleaceae bacterium]
MIEAFITNLGKYNEGELQGEYLKLPATTEDVQALLSRINVDGVVYEEFFITSYETDIPGLSRYLSEYESIDELNYLASLLEGMHKWELAKFEGLVVYSDNSGAKDLINLAQNLECYEYYPDVKDYDDLGHYLIDELGFEEIPERLVNYFDYESYAEDYVSYEGGEFVDSGFIYRNDADFEEHYKGRADLPEEYKIFNYPLQEKSIQKSLANYKEMIDGISKSVMEPAIAVERNHAHENR